uniref:Acyl-coenzyme A oxidase n=1 Tax=Synstelium polycarpum TaxID=361085 RepID=A0A1L2FV09_9MYCE|nr:acyl-CoA oxidase [Synstelium polycarpum]
MNFLSRPDQYKRALDISKRVVDIKRKLGLLDTLGTDIYRALYCEIPIVLHDLVFGGCLRSLASDEQLAQWLPNVVNYRWLGSYAQTELGHGSNVQGLETTIHYIVCTFIKETDEFEINSPTLTSSKYWVGALGKLCTHAIVFGQLMLADPKTGKVRSYGPHPVLVQVRSLEDHMPLKGIVVGDIGPKFGYNTIDNGFMQMDHIRVPRTNLLSRFFSVTRDGVYVPPPHPRLVYAGMVGVRVHLIEESFTALARATTIATRYSVIRRQFTDGPNGSLVERKVMDYGNQQNRIIPGIAASYAFLFMGRRLGIAFYSMMDVIKRNGDTSSMAELHALSSGLKSTVSYITARGIEDARYACGGHGYSEASGLPRLYSSYTHIITAEGENNILPQQTARILLKIYKDAVLNNTAVPAGPTTKYIVQELACPHTTLAQYMAEHGGNLVSIPNLVKLYRHRAFSQVANMARLLQEDPDVPMMERWRQLNVEAQRLSDAHCQLYILESFVTSLASAPADSLAALTRLCQVYALTHIDRSLADFLEDSYLDRSDIEVVRKGLRSLFAQLRPDLVGLVDSFNIADHTLASAIGRYDGQVYEAMLQYSLKQPFNSKPVVDGYEEFIRPLLKSSL